MKKKRLVLLLISSILMSNITSFAQMLESNEEVLDDSFIEADSFNPNDTEETSKTQGKKEDNNEQIEEDIDENDEEKEDKSDEVTEAIKDESEDAIEEDNYFNDFFNDFFQNTQNENEEDQDSEDIPLYDYNSELDNLVFDQNNESFDYFNPNSSYDDFFSDLNYQSEATSDSSIELGTLRTKKDKGPTIQYSLSRKNGVPIFIDTGLEIGSNGTIKEDYVEELLRQISVIKKWSLQRSQNGFILKLKDESLSINKNQFNINDLANSLKKYDIEIKSINLRNGFKSNLVDLLIAKGDIPVYVENERVNLKVKPESNDGMYVVFPIREIVESLDAQIAWNKNKEEVTIKKNNKIIIINNNNNIITINGKKHKLSAPARLNNEAGRMLSLLSLIVKELDGVAYYDAHTAAIHINYIK